MKRSQKNPVSIVIVTGLSGSGKTVALRALEDAGFFCVDNLPVALINSFISIVSKSKEVRSIGIGIDIREKEFLSGVGEILETVKQTYPTDVLFLDAEGEVLVRRFKETRRPHPLGDDFGRAISDERASLFPLREAADRIIDTSSLTPHQLRHLVICTYTLHECRRLMTVALISFGFKYGAPQNVDLLFDARFLPNPHFLPDLKPLKGTDKPVADFVFKSRKAKEFLKKIREFIDFLIPLYVEEGRPYLTIGIGCTGGNHRSPAIIEKLSGYLKKHPIYITVVHRDIT
jgi:UPF0042 nucleotide-binding protein